MIKQILIKQLLKGIFNDKNEFLCKNNAILSGKKKN
jgi:hypothetical protein